MAYLHDKHLQFLFKKVGHLQEPLFGIQLIIRLFPFYIYLIFLPNHHKFLCLICTEDIRRSHNYMGSWILQTLEILKYLYQKVCHMYDLETPPIVKLSETNKKVIYATLKVVPAKEL